MEKEHPLSLYQTKTRRLISKLQEKLQRVIITEANGSSKQSIWSMLERSAEFYQQLRVSVNGLSFENEMEGEYLWDELQVLMVNSSITQHSIPIFEQAHIDEMKTDLPFGKIIIRYLFNDSFGSIDEVHQICSSFVLKISTCQMRVNVKRRYKSRRFFVPSFDQTHLDWYQHGKFNVSNILIACLSLRKTMKQNTLTHRHRIGPRRPLNKSQQ